MCLTDLLRSFRRSKTEDDRTVSTNKITDAALSNTHANEQTENVQPEGEGQISLDVSQRQQNHSNETEQRQPSRENSRQNIEGSVQSQQSSKSSSSRQKCNNNTKRNINYKSSNNRHQPIYSTKGALMSRFDFASKIRQNSKDPSKSKNKQGTNGQDTSANDNCKVYYRLSKKDKYPQFLIDSVQGQSSSTVKGKIHKIKSRIIQQDDVLESQFPKKSKRKQRRASTKTAFSSRELEIDINQESTSSSSKQLKDEFVQRKRQSRLQRTSLAQPKEMLTLKYSKAHRQEHPRTLPAFLMKQFTELDKCTILEDSAVNTQCNDSSSSDLDKFVSKSSVSKRNSRRNPLYDQKKLHPELRFRTSTEPTPAQLKYTQFKQQRQKDKEDNETKANNIGKSSVEGSYLKQVGIETESRNTSDASCIFSEEESITVQKDVDIQQSPATEKRPTKENVKSSQPKLSTEAEHSQGENKTSNYYSCPENRSECAELNPVSEALNISIKITNDCNSGDQETGDRNEDEGLETTVEKNGTTVSAEGKIAVIRSRQCDGVDYLQNLYSDEVKQIQYIESSSEVQESSIETQIAINVDKTVDQTSDLAEHKEDIDDTGENTVGKRENNNVGITNSYTDKQKHSSQHSAEDKVLIFDEQQLDLSGSCEFPQDFLLDMLNSNKLISSDSFEVDSQQFIGGESAQQLTVSENVSEDSEFIKNNFGSIVQTSLSNKGSTLAGEHELNDLYQKESIEDINIKIDQGINEIDQNGEYKDTTRQINSDQAKGNLDGEITSQQPIPNCDYSNMEFKEHNIMDKSEILDTDENTECDEQKIDFDEHYMECEEGDSIEETSTMDQNCSKAESCKPKALKVVDETCLLPLPIYTPIVKLHHYVGLEQRCSMPNDEFASSQKGVITNQGNSEQHTDLELTQQNENKNSLVAEAVEQHQDQQLDDEEQDRFIIQPSKSPLLEEIIQEIDNSTLRNKLKADNAILSQKQSKELKDGIIAKLLQTRTEIGEYSMNSDKITSDTPQAGTLEYIDKNDTLQVTTHLDSNNLYNCEECNLLEHIQAPQFPSTEDEEDGSLEAAEQTRDQVDVQQCYPQCNAQDDENNSASSQDIYCKVGGKETCSNDTHKQIMYSDDREQDECKQKQSTQNGTDVSKYRYISEDECSAIVQGDIFDLENKFDGKM